LRVQLRRAPAAAVALTLGLAPGATRAEVEGAAHVTFFHEPATTGPGVDVVHPQADVRANHGAFDVGAGYEADLVSGATPRVFGPYEGPDAVSGATTFSDTRHVARAHLGVETATVGLTGAYSYGTENDYRSHTATVAARADFLERNLTLGLAYTRNFDTVCDQNNDRANGPLERQPLGNAAHCFTRDSEDTRARGLAIHTFEPSLTWTATPRLLLQMGGTVQLLDGFQSNPYRAVLIGAQGRTPQEHLPHARERFALFVRAHQAIPPLRASLQGFVRGYRDTWDVLAATAEGSAQKYLGNAIVVGARARYHQQTGAIFYRTGADYRSLGPTGAYFTGDRELSPFSSVLFGGKLSYVKKRQQEARTPFEEIEVNVKFDFLLYYLDPGAPNRDRKAAQILQAGVVLRL
jgi:hypothetical protein